MSSLQKMPGIQPTQHQREVDMYRLKYAIILLNIPVYLYFVIGITVSPTILAHQFDQPWFYAIYPYVVIMGIVSLWWVYHGDKKYTKYLDDDVLHEE